MALYAHFEKKIVSLFRSFCLSLYKRKFSSQEVLVRLRSQLYRVTEFLLFKVNLQSQWDHGRVSSRFFWRDEDYRKTQQTERPLQTRTDYLHLRYRDVILGTKIGSDQSHLRQNMTSLLCYKFGRKCVYHTVWLLRSVRLVEFGDGV